MKINWKGCINCLLVGLVIVVIAALAYSITLGMKQQERLIEMDGALDRIMNNVRLLEAEQNKKAREKQEMDELENKTTEEMKDLSKTIL